MIEKKILKKERMSHNTFMLTLENNETIYEQRTCFFVNIFDKDASRSKPYTPVKYDNNGLVFIIKYYNVGGVADYICSRGVGDKLFISEPIYKISLNNNFGHNILMLAGGTGITPMIQFINSTKGLILL